MIENICSVLELTIIFKFASIRLIIRFLEDFYILLLYKNFCAQHFVPLKKMFSASKVHACIDLEHIW